jgi:hypothetical protein
MVVPHVTDPIAVTLAAIALMTATVSLITSIVVLLAAVAFRAKLP